MAATTRLAIPRGQCPSRGCRDQFYGYPDPIRIRANARHEFPAGAALDHVDGGSVSPDRFEAASFLSIGFVAATAIVFVSHGKDYYLFPVYPTMFALGAAACANLPRWLHGLWLAAAGAVFVLNAPIVLPILNPATLEKNLALTHLAPDPEEAAAVGTPLTQIFSDQLGWRELEKRVATIYRSLSPEDRKKAAILATNCGEAAALDFYGGADGLPPALCGQDQYFLWGNRGYDGEIIIHVSGDPGRWQRGGETVDIVGKFGVPYAMPYENGRPIFICRGLRRNLSEVWSRLKRYE